MFKKLHLVEIKRSQVNKDISFTVATVPPSRFLSLSKNTTFNTIKAWYLLEATLSSWENKRNHMEILWTKGALKELTSFFLSFVCIKSVGELTLTLYRRPIFSGGGNRTPPSPKPPLCHPSDRKLHTPIPDNPLRNLTRQMAFGIIGFLQVDSGESELECEIPFMVLAFVKSNQFKNSPNKAKCHACEIVNTY
ncbi:hypothetical protein L1887_17654 [Cichorium endivia]|nr:hypothetical protein L1887_17654 [Cichorium endivia]